MTSTIPKNVPIWSETCSVFSDLSYSSFKIWFMGQIRIHIYRISALHRSTSLLKELSRIIRIGKLKCNCCRGNLFLKFWIVWTFCKYSGIKGMQCNWTSMQNLHPMKYHLNLVQANWVHFYWELQGHRVLTCFSLSLFSFSLFQHKLKGA